jgi:hypothetical protein
LADSQNSTTKCLVRVDDPQAVARRHVATSADVTITDPNWASKYFDGILPIIAPRVDHLEFIRTYLKDDSLPAGEKQVHGVTLFDEYNWPIVHLNGALLGFDGSGPLLSKHILQQLGLGDEVFTQVNDLVRTTQQDYAVIIELAR